MSDVWEKMILDLNQIGEKVANKTGIYIKKAVSKGEELTRKGKIQIEIEKTKREYKQKLVKLGEYILEESKKGVCDFSLDSIFQKQIDKLIIIKNHLLGLEEEKKNNINNENLKNVG
jgi:hypothetical protein